MTFDNRYLKAGRDGPADEMAIYRDAWRIADPGASNPVAVAGTLAQASSALLRSIGTDGVKRHPALRLMAAQLASLYNVDSDGGSNDGAGFIDEVKVVVDLLERGRTDVCPVCKTYNDFPCKDQHQRGKINQYDHRGRPQTMERDLNAYGGPENV